MLGYFLWMSRLSPKARVFILIALFLLLRTLRATTISAPPAVTAVAWPLLIAGMLFVLLSWVADPLFNLVLRFDRFGRYALTRRQAMSTNWLVGLLAGAAVSGVAAYAFSQPALAAMALCMAAMILPISATYGTATQTQFRQGATVCVALAVMATLLVVGMLIGHTTLAAMFAGAFGLVFIGSLLVVGVCRKG